MLHTFLDSPHHYNDHKLPSAIEGDGFGEAAPESPSLADFAEPIVISEEPFSEQWSEPPQQTVISESQWSEPWTERSEPWSDATEQTVISESQWSSEWSESWSEATEQPVASESQWSAESQWSEWSDTTEQAVISESQWSEPWSEWSESWSEPPTVNAESELSPPDYFNLPDPRPQRSPSHEYFLSVATMFKNERRWLREWLEFGLMMGVEHFFLYDHDSTDSPLEILQPYIDDGYVTYIPWPPAEIVQWKVTTVQEKEQWEWYRDCLETCLANLWTVHTQGPCQMAAFSDAILRTKGGVSRWLGIWDIDEYIFPRVGTEYRSLAALLRDKYWDTDHIKVDGNNFGTSGHVEHAARRRPGDALPALLTEAYTYRAGELRPDEYPFAKLEALEMQSKGTSLGKVEFKGADLYGHKSLADPDMVSYSWIHCFLPPSSWADWNEEMVYSNSTVWKFNHYAFLSQADVDRKARSNKNPFLMFDSQVDRFFSREKDTEVQFYVPELKRRMLRSLQDNPPPHPDDWEPEIEMDREDVDIEM